VAEIELRKISEDRKCATWDSELVVYGTLFKFVHGGIQVEKYG
jgi:hypothetical protein